MWISREDSILTDCVLQFAREGKSMSFAYHEASKRLGRRSPDSCSTRWQMVLKAKYKKALEEAKEQGKKHKKEGRMPSWSNDEDEVLAHIVLSFIKEGKPRYEAYELAAEELMRSPMSCRTRWEKSLKQQYEIKSKVSNRVEKQKNPQGDTLAEEMIKMIQRYAELEAENNHLKKEKSALKRENYEIKKQFKELRIQHDYYEEVSDLMNRVMENSRKMVVWRDDIVNGEKITFRMDRNGNLERDPK